MLQAGDLNRAFETYWNEMHQCRTAKAYWALLHVTVCIPDICAALESQNGEATPASYKAWCGQYLIDPLLSASERYRIRCKILHQGRATTDQPSRYTAFAFGQPSETGEVDHKRVIETVLHLDVGELAREMKSAVEEWIRTIEERSSSAAAMNVERNLQSLVRVKRTVVRPKTFRGGGSTFVVAKTTSNY